MTIHIYLSIYWHFFISKIHREDCHYHGYAENEENSTVVMSTCNGLRFLLHFPFSKYLSINRYYTHNTNNILIVEESKPSIFIVNRSVESLKLLIFKDCKRPPWFYALKI